MGIPMIPDYALVHKRHEAVQFTPDAIQLIMSWVKNDFVAVTNGNYAITVAGNTVQCASQNEDTDSLKEMTNLILIIKDSGSGNLIIAGLNDWIVKHPILGYQVYTHDEMQGLYHIYVKNDD